MPNEPVSYKGVMVSSTFTDLVEHRKALIKAIDGQELKSVGMEHDSAKPAIDVLASSLEMLRDASAYVGIISHKYGQIPEDAKRNPEGLSLTELEFREAVRLGRPVLLFIMGPMHPVTLADVESDPDKKQKLLAFTERAKRMSSVDRVYKIFNNIHEFEVAAMQSVAELRRALEAVRRPEGEYIPTPPALYAEPPYIGSHAFVGREAQLVTLSDWAAAADPHPVLLFEAIGGTGKSMLTWEWTTKHATVIRGDWAGRFWYSFYEKGAVMADFCQRALAYMTGRTLEEFRKKKMTELSELLLQQLRARPWLLILDGLERVLVAYHRIDAPQFAGENAGSSDALAGQDPCAAIHPEDDNLLRELASAIPSKLLLTSRLIPRVLLNPASQSIPGVLHERLPGLRPQDAEKLLRSCGVTGSSEEMQSYLKSHGDGHPLVTGVLAGLVNDYFPDRGNFDAWAKAYDGGAALNLADLDLVQKRHHILRAALDALPEKSQQLLSTLALLSAPVDSLALSALNPEIAVTDEFANTVRDLERRGLLQYDRQTKRYDIHPVIRAIVASHGKPVVPTPPTELLRAFVDNEVVLYAGAGLSFESGFPLWPNFVRSLVDIAVEHSAVDNAFALSLYESWKLGKFDFVADSVVSALQEQQPGTLENHLRKVFLRPNAPLSRVHEELPRLRFRAVMTTNFDELLETTFADRPFHVYEPPDTEQLIEAIGKREFFILKLYGRVQSHAVMVAPAQYEEVIRGNRAFSSVIETLFFSTTILFLGASLEGIEAYLRGISLPGLQKRKHYALVAVSGTAWRTTADLLRRRYGIEVIPLDATGYIGGRVSSFVRQLISHAPEVVAVSTNQARKITRVTLQNIGPFTSLEMELDPKWNVLLGDNGVGKSSILRAIAAALVGRQFPYADRLIKADTSPGEIAIDIGKASYKTEIHRGTGGGGEVVSHLSPIEAEGVLALGFPALRTVSWSRPKSPTVDETLRRPTASDLSPLIEGGTDPRMDDLKQWIVSMDYRSRSAPTDPNSPVLKTFFEIIGNIAEGMTLSFEGVNRETYEVKIRTADGPLPLEALSQGTISLLGWIGMLVQRLSEVFGTDDTPLKDRPAIVLIDEIDAHLHPAWQQILVARLSEQFPNIQFIATTHSPLIVGGMLPSQVFRFIRDDDGQVEQVKVEPEMTVGRTDQILTGDLFGLDTTLDSETLKAREEYRKLLGLRSRQPHEERRLLELEDVLGFRIPPAVQTPAEQQAYQLLEALLRRSVGNDNVDVQKNVLDAGKKLLDTLAKQDLTTSK